MQFTLNQLGLIDAPQEEQYDNLTNLASEFLQVPVSHVSVADLEQKRIFFKSQHGHAAELAAARQLPMELTYCQHVALTQAPLIVTDAREHPLLKGTPALTEGHPRAYLGMPVSLSNHQIIGGLCMMQPEPRVWTDGEIAIAKKLAACVSDLIRLKAATLTSERLRNEQRQFTYAISHDLLSPANTLQWILDEVALESDILTSDCQTLIEEGKGTVDRMRLQVEEVLHYSRTIDQDSSTESISLGTLVKEVLNDLKGDIAATGASINIGDMPVISCNRMQFKALLQNLVCNALKYRAPGRNPELTISTSFDDSAGQHCISVKDNGIGIAPEDQETVFNLFTRLHLQDEYPGTGIGLALCHRVAENHNGSISIDSDGQNGSTFTVKIPGPG